MSAPARLLTFDDLQTLPDIGTRYELIDGVLVVPPAPSWMHADVVAELLGILRDHVRSREPGGRVLAAPVDLRLSNMRVVQPDILYVSPGRHSLFAHPPAVHGAPDFVVEVLSPSNPDDDQVDKFTIYEESGVREYWIVDRVAATLTVYVLRDGRYVTWISTKGRATSVVLAGLELDVAALFARLA